ncbi:GTP pyrophosphokinase [Vibrio sp. TRT 21S02]|uniref:GTP pyrophosphokinase n=1 Tax=Vibrio sp. TRT 21S02 TaxID=3418507 RepID=UPI003CF7213F
MSKEQLIKEYDEKLGLYTQFSTSIESLISRLLSVSEITPHSISSRVKERSSLVKKIEKKDKYKSLSELTDVVGIRLISHYSDEVDKIASIIEQEFEVDRDNSIDKRASLDPDRFGYLSLHYVVSLSDSRSGLIEYSKFSGLKFEVQIRSILQHTWAEIEHDIGYKSKIEIPKPVRRKFSQLAGLLELADDQFIQIRNELSNYETDVRDVIVSSPQSVDIDTVTVLNYCNTNKFLNKLDREIAQILNVELIDLNKENASRHVKYLDYFKINNFSQLDEYVNKYQKYIMKRAGDIGEYKDSETVSRGISVFYLYQILASQLDSEANIFEFLNLMGLSWEEKREEFAKYLYEFGEKIV